MKRREAKGKGEKGLFSAYYYLLINKQVMGENVLSDAGKAAADLNGDGSITSADASALQKLIFGQ